jgi:hypothetical protein
MTPEQVCGEFAGAFVEGQAVVMDGVRLGSISFGDSERHRHPITATARFTFQRVIGLQRVRLTMNNPTDEQFQALRAGLNQLYGPPDFTTEMSARWDFVRTVITLVREDDRQRSPSSVWLQYQSVNQSELK